MAIRPSRLQHQCQFAVVLRFRMLPPSKRRGTNPGQCGPPPMNAQVWLRATECPLLQAEAEGDPLALRLVQRLLELSLTRQGSDDTARGLLEEMAPALRADQAAVCEASPQWQARWQYSRRGTRVDALPRALLSDVLDREAGVNQPSGANQPAIVAACLSYV